MTDAPNDMARENEGLRGALEHIVNLTENEPDEHPVSLATRLMPIRQVARDTLRALSTPSNPPAPYAQGDDACLDLNAQPAETGSSPTVSKSTFAADTDTIPVPRSLLAAAAHCARKHAGADSSTYQQLSAAALSNPPAPSDGVRSDEYYKALEDGRVLRWHPIASRPDDRAVIVGGDSDLGVWYMKRAMPNTNSALWIGDRAGLMATHWCEDVLGTPHIVVRAPGLPRR